MRRGRGGLADAARAGADDDALARPAASSRSVARSSARSSPSRASAARAPGVSKTNGSVRTGASPSAAPQPRQLRRVRRAPGPPAPRAARTARDGGAASSAATSPPRKRCGITPLTTTRSSRGPQRVGGQRVAQLERLVDRHLLGRRDRDDGGLLGVGEHRVDLPALPRDAAPSARRRRTSRARSAARRRGRSRARRGRRGRRGGRPACGGPAGRAPRPCRRSAARAGPAWPREVGEHARLRTAGRQTPRGSWSRRYSSIASRGRSRCGAGRRRGALDERGAGRRSAAERPRDVVARATSATIVRSPRAAAACRARRRPSTCRRRPCR